MDPVDVKHIIDWFTTLGKTKFTRKEMVKVMVEGNYEKWLERKSHEIIAKAFGHKNSESLEQKGFDIDL